MHASQKIKIREKEEKYPIHIGPVFPCIFCKMNFINLFFLEKHQKKCLKIKIDSFHKNREILKKVHEKKNKLILKKKESLKTIKTKTELNCHLQTKKKFYDCFFCKKTSTNLYKHKKHLHTHKVGEYFICNICDEKNFYLDDFKKHLRMHAVEKHRSIMLSTTRDYQFHFSKDPDKCNFCNVMLSRSNDITRHLQFECNKNPYKCDICEKRFAYIGTLKLHRETHNKNKCEISKNNDINMPIPLKKERTRSNILRSYKYEKCNRSFSTTGLLNKHLLIHSNKECPKQDQCEFCKEMFSDTNELVKHLQFNCTRNPMRCEICKKMFAYLGSYKIHLQTHEPEDSSLKCRFCQMPFKNKYNIETHLLLEHNHVQGN